MGYTHYVTPPKSGYDPARFAKFTLDCETIIKHLPNRTTSAGGYYLTDPLKLADGDGTGKPFVGPTLVRFNGRGKLAHEAFQVNVNDTAWNFCKTDRKPYDLAVCACLIRLAYHFPEGVQVASDGERADWEPARQFVEDLFGVAVLPPEIVESWSAA